MAPLVHISKPQRRRVFPYRNLDFGLGPGHAGDFNVYQEEDPRQRGILQSANCRRYRDRLRSSRKSHILQGFSIFTAVLMVLLLLIFLGIEMGGDQIEEPEQQQSGVWMRVLQLLGLATEEERPRKSQFETIVKPDIPESDSCNPLDLDMRRIFRLMGRRVLNQEHALARMERALSGTGQFRSVALLGPQGVGKTLAANVLRQNFPWPANAHSYSWNTGVSEEVMKFRLVRQFAERLVHCGVNLLIIDNLSTCDHGLVPIYNRLIREREGELDRNQTVLVIYIFDLETNMYWEQFELLQQLSEDTTIVSFRFFGRDDVLDCLDHELKAEQRYLSKEKESLVMEEAMKNVEDTGCKSLRLLVLKHGVSCAHIPC